ncbi:hypothetical protein F4825DRAFT_446366 [Nemania diffusa]|nr:hypothetical protein F4825DRAFT_446366 [Nemania diffusa]
MEPRPPYKDSPPSYVEAMSADYDYPSSSRRLTAARTSSTFHPVLYCHLSSDAHVFPRTFGVYTSTPRHYYIGGSQEFPLYAISTRSLQPMKPDLVLYSGVSEDMPALASVLHDTLTRSASIALPAPPNSNSPAVHEPLQASGAFFSRTLSFAIETPAAAAAAAGREHFEWRRSGGGEVDSLRGRPLGWKLVRLTPPPDAASKTKTSGGGDDRYCGGYVPGHSSDGREVVAVWVGPAAPALFASKVLRFRFLGAGADGSLGPRWAVMAVASALAVWHREHRGRHRGLASASF